MNKLMPLLLICYLCLVAFILIDGTDANETKAVLQRNRRYLSFLNMTRFFIRFNFKDNVIPWNQLFAHALGFRMNWDAHAPSIHTFHRIYRRDIYSYLETLLTKNGLDGFHCVRRAICEVQIISEPNFIYHKILKIVFRRISSATERWHNTTSEDCYTSLSTCPLSLLQVAPFTDVA